MRATETRELKSVRSILPIASMCMLIFACSHRANPEESNILQSDQGSPVIIHDGVLVLTGFSVSGDYAEQSSRAIEAASSACDRLYVELLERLGRFRFVEDPGSSSYRRCGEPTNETPFRMGFFYVYRPEFKIRVDPGDEIIEVGGPEIVGDEAPQHRLSEAYRSHNQKCLEAMDAIKKERGSSFVAAECGESKSSIRMEYLESHRMEMPNLTVRSQMRVYLRKTMVPESKPIQLQAVRKFSVPTFDSANALVPGAQNAPIVYAVGFAGSVTKINLESRQVEWDRNLTNPIPSSVRMTTAINSVTTSRDGRFVAVGADYGYLALLDANTGRKERIFSCDPAMFAPRNFVGLHFDRSTRHLYSAASLEQYPNHDTNYNRMIFAGYNNTRIGSKEVSKWDAENGKEIWKKSLEVGDVVTLGGSSDDRLIYLVTTDRVVILDSQKGDQLKEYQLKDYEGELKGSVITGARFSEDMRNLAIAAFSGIMLINTENSKLLRRFRSNEHKFDLGNPEIALSDDRIRAQDAFGHFFEWELSTGRMTGYGANKEMNIARNGPPSMPILSISNGRFVVMSSMAGLGSGVSIPRAQEIPAYDKLCAAGEGSELPPLNIRKLAGLSVWSIGEAVR